MDDTPKLKRPWPWENTILMTVVLVGKPQQDFDEHGRTIIRRRAMAWTRALGEMDVPIQLIIVGSRAFNRAVGKLKQRAVYMVEGELAGIEDGLPIIITKNIYAVQMGTKGGLRSG